jgi:tetratricopeptide (TPR) repeat protein
LTTLLIGIVWFTVPGCSSSGRAGGAVSGAPPLYDGLGSHTRPVKTTSPLAQRYFDQALIFTYAFNHDEAIRAYTEAARLDPNCAMAWWGVALCNGPHINNPAVDAAHSAAAWAALQRALALQSNAAATDRALIRALAKRYADPPPTDRRPLDEAYAQAMREVWRASRGDADVGVLTAEALMDLQPWDLWTKEGQAQGNTLEIVGILEEVIASNPDHPGALHLYIHAVEASQNPGRAAAAADRLRRLVPAAGHLVHMPAHIDVRTGKWQEAADANVRAIVADRKYRETSPRQGFYHIYMAHNYHFLSYAAMMEGGSAVAINAARELIAGIPEEYARGHAALVDPVTPIVFEALMRFGRWDDILREPAPPTYLPVTTAFWRFARGVAYAAQGKVADAEREQVEFRAAVQKVPPDALMAINRAHTVLKIADHVLSGEIDYRRGRIDEAVRELAAATRIEDDLKYMEPPDWIQPVRHTTGAILVSAGRFSDAEVVYREDLQRWPENGWSLFGLWQCLKARGATAEAGEIDERFKKAWSRADVQIPASCLCVARGG